MADDGAWYFGPYHSATDCREALRVVNRHFRLRTCTDHVLHHRVRPCLQCQIKRCMGPCCVPVSREEYAEQVRDVRLFLEGKNQELLDGLRVRMKEAAAQTCFESAAILRDQIRALETVLQTQNVISSDMLDQDVVGYWREGPALEIVVMSVRQGKLQGSRAFSFARQEFPDDEILSSFLGLFYDLAATASLPEEVLLPFAVPDVELKADWLSEKRGRKVALLVPQRGPRRDLLELARKNANNSFNTRRNAREDAEATLGRLQRRLGLPQLPRTIECYDISHIQGTETVASMVVFVDGQPEKTRYRTFKVKRAEQPDDFASMYEVLSRRFRRAREAAAAGEEESTWRLPELVVVDGGKGQLGVALAAARDVGIDVGPGTGLPIIALAKERDFAKPGEAAEPASAEPAPSPSAAPGSDDRRPDRVFLPAAKDAIPIRPNSAEMFVLQRLRDEAHRFAVSFHRSQRRRRTLRSALSAITGIGPNRQRELLRHFGSVKKIREASLDDLAAVPGMTRNAATAVVEYFASHPATPAPEITPSQATPDEAGEDAVSSAFSELDPEQSG
jgi:excinuclease ABC subunit C